MRESESEVRVKLDMCARAVRERGRKCSERNLKRIFV